MKSDNLHDLLANTRYWQKYTNGLCKSCIGTCCYLPVEAKIEDLVRAKIVDSFVLELSEKDQLREIQKHPAINRYNSKSQMFTLTQKSNGSCYYLDDKGLCSIYENRPNTCRNHPKVGPKPGYCAYKAKC